MEGAWLLYVSGMRRAGTAALAVCLFLYHSVNLSSVIFVDQVKDKQTFIFQISFSIDHRIEFDELSHEHVFLQSQEARDYYCLKNPTPPRAVEGKTAVPLAPSVWVVPHYLPNPLL